MPQLLYIRNDDLFPFLVSFSHELSLRASTHERSFYLRAFTHECLLTRRRRRHLLALQITHSLVEVVLSGIHLTDLFEQAPPQRVCRTLC